MPTIFCEKSLLTITSNMSEKEVSVDNYIRSRIQDLRVQTHVVEPSLGFVENVVRHAVEIENQRRARINIWFAVTALAPYVLRQLWSLIRSDFVSLSGLPFGDELVTAYQVLMSSFASYALVAGGIVLAVFIVGFPKWRLERE